MGESADIQWRNCLIVNGSAADMGGLLDAALGKNSAASLPPLCDDEQLVINKPMKNALLLGFSSERPARSWVTRIGQIYPDLLLHLSWRSREQFWPRWQRVQGQEGIAGYCLFSKDADSAPCQRQRDAVKKAIGKLTKDEVDWERVQMASAITGIEALREQLRIDLRLVLAAMKARQSVTVHRRRKQETAHLIGADEDGAALGEAIYRLATVDVLKAGRLAA